LTRPDLANRRLNGAPDGSRRGRERVVGGHRRPEGYQGPA
jgi:hypothetical protein